MDASLKSTSQGSTASCSEALAVAHEPPHTMIQAATARDTPDGAAAPLPNTAAAIQQAVREDDEHASKAAYPRTNPRVVPLYYKILIVGASGLGKTAFIRNLFEPYSTPGTSFDAHDGSSTNLQAFIDNPKSMCIVLENIPHAHSTSLNISIQDTPGYGDDLSTEVYLERIVGYIHSQWQADNLANNGVYSAACIRPGTLEHAVSVCLFFVPPHRASQIDLLLIAALSGFVPVIPVISKADSMTADELQCYRNTLQGLFQLGKTVDDGRRVAMNIYHFKPERLKEVGVDAGHDTRPFAVIASNQVDRSGGGYSPERRYQWGVCKTLDRQHSDTIVLKRLLMGDKVDSFWDLLEISITKYQEFSKKYQNRLTTGEQNPTGAMVKDACRAAVEALKPFVAPAPRPLCAIM